MTPHHGQIYGSSAAVGSSWFPCLSACSPPCLCPWKLLLVCHDAPRNNEFGKGCVLELRYYLSSYIDNAAHSPKTRLGHPHCKVFTDLQLILLLGGNKEMQTKPIAVDAHGHLPTSLLADAMPKCQRAANVLPEPRSSLPRDQPF